MALTLIDLHSHILPALDDGPRTIEESLDLARSAVADGVGILACTPHNQKKLTRPVIEAAVKELRAALAAAGIPLRLAIGVEVLLEADMDALIAEERAFCLHNTRYMLIELPFDFWPPFTEQALFDLQLRGIVPIIAHPDRYRAVQTDPNRLVPLIERGALAQLTAGSLLGDFGPGPQRCAEALLKQNLVQLMASDSHNPRRATRMTAGAAAAAKLVGQEKADALVYDVPAQILANELIEVEMPKRNAPSGRRWWFGGR